jgi:hypothetical protein
MWRYLAHSSRRLASLGVGRDKPNPDFCLFSLLPSVQNPFFCWFCLDQASEIPESSIGDFVEVNR